MQTSTRKGFGTVVSVLPGRVVVLQTMPNTPSEKAGMSPGDEILAVNNYRLDRLDPDQIIELLSESKQKPAQLVVRRPGNARLVELTLTPEEMKTSSVERVFELKPGIGYIRVAAFEEKTAQQIHDGDREARRAQSEGPGARSAQQSRRPDDGRARDGVVFSQARTGDSVGERPQCRRDDREGSGRTTSLIRSRWR